MTSVATIAPAALAEYAPGVSFGPRQLLEFEFVWVLRGSVRWTRHDATPDGDQEHVLRPGQLAFSRQSTVDSYHWDERRTTVHGYVHFELEEPDRPAISVPPVREMAEVPLFAPICDYLIELGSVAGPEARWRTDQLTGLLLDLYVGGRLGDPVPELPEPMGDVLAEIRRLWRRDGLRLIGAEELAAAARISPGHLFRLFREHIGLGPAQALELIRLSRAAVMLQRSNSPLSEVARTCGFANAYHLSRRFVAAYGQPPGRFRRESGADPMEPVREAGLLALGYRLTDGGAFASTSDLLVQLGHIGQ